LILYFIIRYGGHTMIFGTEENGAIGRFEYAEFRYMVLYLLKIIIYKFVFYKI